ncbi:MAG TPA: hypothetical protein VKE93_12050 [Candidatus Angelobacter sp.]|nr:hypothetical protein [Candidatus Angelobacter sp.]
MKIAIDHAKDTLVGWDIKVTVQADTGENIANVEVRVNDFPEISDAPSDGLNSWEQLIRQKGVFPGDNKVEVLVSDQNDKETRAVQKWS